MCFQIMSEFPVFSELEISAQVRWHTINTNTYVLETNLCNFDVLVVRTVIERTHQLLSRCNYNKTLSRRYPSREHQPPSRYDNYIRL